MVFGATGGNAYKGSVALDFYAWITHKISKKINFYKSLIKVRQIGITDLSVPPPIPQKILWHLSRVRIGAINILR